MTWFLLVLVFGVGPAIRGLFRVTSGRQPGGGGGRPADPFCRACHIDHPPFASYCRRCGRRL